MVIKLLDYTTAHEITLSSFTVTLEGRKKRIYKNPFFITDSVTSNGSSRPKSKNGAIAKKRAREFDKQKDFSH